VLRQLFLHQTQASRPFARPRDKEGDGGVLDSRNKEVAALSAKTDRAGLTPFRLTVAQDSSSEPCAMLWSLDEDIGSALWGFEPVPIRHKPSSTLRCHALFAFG
jgi:hypothetical protein